MENLRNLYKATIEALTQKEQELVSFQEILAKKETQLVNTAKQIDLDRIELEKEQRAVAHIKDVLQVEKDNAQAEVNLNSLSRELNIKKQELRTKENELVEIGDSQDLREKALQERERVLSVKEEDYKRILRDEFDKNMSTLRGEFAKNISKVLSENL